MDLERLDAALVSLREATRLSRHYGDADSGGGGNTPGEAWVLPESLMQTAAALTVIGTSRSNPDTLAEAVSVYAASLPHMRLMDAPHQNRLQAMYRMQQVIHFRRQIDSTGGWYRGLSFPPSLVPPAPRLPILAADRECDAAGPPRVTAAWVTCEAGYSEGAFADGSKIFIFEARLDVYEDSTVAGLTGPRDGVTALLYLEDPSPHEDDLIGDSAILAKVTDRIVEEGARCNFETGAAGGSSTGTFIVDSPFVVLLHCPLPEGTSLPEGPVSVSFLVGGVTLERSLCPADPASDPAHRRKLLSVCTQHA